MSRYDILLSYLSPKKEFYLTAKLAKRIYQTKYLLKFNKKLKKHLNYTSGRIIPAT